MSRTSDLTGVEVDPDYELMLESLFADASSRAYPEGKLDREWWRQVDDLGLVLLTGPEDRGGSGAGWAEAWALHRAAARHGVRLPLGEHDLLGSWLVDRVGWSSGGHVLTVGVGEDGREVVVPWGEEADTVLLVSRGVDGAAVSSHRSHDLRWSRDGELPVSHRARTHVPEGAPRTALPAELFTELRLRGALLRSIQIVGSLERCVDVAVDHARVRTQFGRPLIAFQAVQAMLADAAGEVALARAAVVAAVREAEDATDLTAVTPAVAVAKSCASHAVAPVTRHAHQVLGAMGTTREHELHRFSMPALGWRGDFGTGEDWDAELGGVVEASGLTAAWRWCVDGPGRG